MAYRPRRTINLFVIVTMIGISAIVIPLMVSHVDSTKIKQEHFNMPDLVINSDENTSLSSFDDNVNRINSTPYQKILESCNNTSKSDSHVGLIFYNGTHYIDNFTCEWELIDCNLMDVKCLEMSIPNSKITDRFDV